MLYMKERIKLLRKKLELNQTEFGNRIGLKQATIAGYENGARNPNDSVLLSICREFNVNKEWIKTGVGDMFKKPTDEVGYYVEDLLEYSGSGNPFYDAIIDMMKKYHELDDNSKIIIRDFFRKASAVDIEKERD